MHLTCVIKFSTVFEYSQGKLLDFWTNFDDLAKSKLMSERNNAYSVKM